MATGMALTIGVNAVDPKHYQGWKGTLAACEADAQEMAGIAQSRGFEVKTLLTKTATRMQVINEFANAANTLKAGDIFIVTYAGHGGQLPDLNNDEDDGLDETWCLYDGQFVDDELYAYLGKFASGVRILVFSDSCHSGTVVRSAYDSPWSVYRQGQAGEIQYRYMPQEVALRVYRTNKSFYDPILQENELSTKSRVNVQSSIQASVLLISGCQDNQLSSDGPFNGLFTGNLLRVWNSGKFEGNYWALHKTILQRMPPIQTPNYFRMGQVDENFETQQAFTI